MSETESSPGKQAEVIIAANLSSIPPLLDIIPRESKRPYVVFDLRRMSIEPPIIGATITEPEAYVPNLSDGGLLVVTGMDFDSPGEAGRTMQRQILRLAQFARLRGIIDDSLYEDRKRLTPDLLSRLKHVVAAWYWGELSAEPLTRQVAIGISQNRLPQPDAVVATAEGFIRARSLNLPDIFDEVYRILNPYKFEIIPNIESETGKAEREQIANEAHKREEAQRERIGDVIEGLQIWKKSQNPKTLYAFDPEMDYPSPEAVAFFAELMDRPF